MLANICTGDEISVVTLTQKIISASNGLLQVISFFIYLIHHQREL